MGGLRGPGNTAGRDEQPGFYVRTQLKACYEVTYGGTWYMKGTWQEEVFALLSTQSERHSWGETITARSGAYSRDAKNYQQGQLTLLGRLLGRGGIWADSQKDKELARQERGAACANAKGE